MNNQKENQNDCNCNENCTCGCQEGKECTCGDNCHCNDDHCDCGCQEGKECTCGDDCHCNDDHCNCGCQEGEECTCGDDCHCNDDHCNCGCEDGEPVEGSEEYKKYEKAFIQLENALILADQERVKAEKKASENEHLAISIKKDFERFKERTKEEENKVKENAVSEIANTLIPVLDNFDQALNTVIDQNILKGFEMIRQQLEKAVQSLGIEEIESLGKEFDPNLHNAVAKRKTKDKKLDNTIATVYQKGYKLSGKDGKIVRHATVEIYLQD